jgi:hypothetical protein
MILGVGCGRGSQADLDGIEVLQRAPPDRNFARPVTAMALIGDDDV